ncbi:hypothetical protein M1C59_11270 [Gordonia terrae]|uniref:hypothetical protein n=1 Tax=Gordonia terrae TaxID=2055 RepID=UPI00200A18B8|nr:hypothetical protein [Gordonia terrae]UPW11345.1 hypothetical protein M1C59_11270 [Gordonia terrae]
MPPKALGTLAAATLALTIAACTGSGIEPAAMTRAGAFDPVVEGPAPPIRIAVDTPSEPVPPHIDPWPLPDDAALRPDQQRAIAALVDLSTGNAGEKLAQRSTCRVLNAIQSPPADAPGWQVRILATVTMRHGYALLAAPQQRSADAAVVVLARVLADVDAVAGQPYRPVFVQGCSPY